MTRAAQIGTYVEAEHDVALRGRRLPVSHTMWSVRVASRPLARAARTLPRTQVSWTRMIASRTASLPLEAMPVPCVDQHELRERRVKADFQRLESGEMDEEKEILGPEPSYTKVVSGYELFTYENDFPLDYGSTLPGFQIAYETWGTLNEARDNVILLHTGLSASSHAASTPENTAKGWWEDFIGPGKALDTNRFFVICTNVLGSCYGSTGPSTPHPLDETGSPYATRFPVLSIFDMIRAQFLLLDHLGIDQVYASVGSSMGGMQSVAASHLFTDRVQRVVSISGCARSAPSGIALRYAQRSVLMSDENWNRGFYYGPDKAPPHKGMKLARQIATITYRSGPEWEQRFGRQRRSLLRDGESVSLRAPALCPDFLVETYLDHQGEQFCLKYDANSLIYISKAMDLFDMTDEALSELGETRMLAHGDDGHLPIEPMKHVRPRTRPHITTIKHPGAHAYVPALARGLSRVQVPVLIIGVQSDILFPVEQQREMAECIRMNGNPNVMYYEIDAPHGHDSFLIDVANVGGALKGFLN
ncbi:homoserine o-acetyltransferase [Malassezia pachydermatis]|uniref:Homoserine o-acetyltransferase n=1 Tax=Malassezia pachydermatis TaxID=77020 RepID=A0A0N0RS51_9BASI|nr:homoserine o-acetyltransferase [Malassezia pachydermatis]KOS13745.1 homoserine o-acetyltransferase [Malassezia pachydermatis]